MPDCIFCKIAAGEIPAKIRYEDSDVVAFDDISPQSPVHILVVPRRHVVSAADVTPENSQLVARCFEAIASIAARENLSGGFRVITNSGPDAGQTVHHLHFHVLAGRSLGPKLLAEN